MGWDCKRGEEGRGGLSECYGFGAVGLIIDDEEFE